MAVGAVAALMGAMAVVMGAFAAHALRERLAEPMLHAVDVGSRYQLIHAVLIAVLAQVPFKVSVGLLWSFVAGTLLFSVSLYAMALSGVRALGMITPLGGSLLIVCWMWLAVALVRKVPAVGA